jgi:hypothetical protein
MEIHFDKIIPVVIAVALIYLNTRKKSKKQTAKPQQPSNEASEPQPATDHDVFNPLFRGLSDILNINQPVPEAVMEPVTEPEPEKIRQMPVKEPIVQGHEDVLPHKPDIFFHDTVTEPGHFEFDPRRAIIEAEIINRKYFTLLSNKFF